MAVPEPVAALLDDLATEVRRQLANKHSARSPWAPRDLVRFAGAYAALGHRTPKAGQMLDVLASFCVHRIRSRHLNCLSRPRDLTGGGRSAGMLRSAVQPRLRAAACRCGPWALAGRQVASRPTVDCPHIPAVLSAPLPGLLEAYADLEHCSVAVPDLLAAVGEQVRQAATAQLQEQRDAAVAAEAAAAAAAASPPGAGGARGAATPAAAAAAHQPQRSVEGFTLPDINSLLASHLRLGYQPPPLLLQCLAAQIRRQLPHSSAGDAATLLRLLAAAPQCSPGSGLVSLLLARVLDASGEEGDEGVAAAARRAAASLLGGAAS